jgi:hypothetical protein
MGVPPSRAWMRSVRPARAVVPNEILRDDHVRPGQWFDARVAWATAPCVQFWGGWQSLLLTSRGGLLHSVEAIRDLEPVGADFGEALKVKRRALDCPP